MIPKPSFIYFLITISSLVWSQRCLNNQFLSTNIDGCADCPEDPKSNCQYEGDDSKSCELSCTQVEAKSKQTSSRSKVAIPVGIAAVISLVLIVGLVVYFYKLRTRQHGHPREHEEIESQNGEPNERRYRGPEIAPDLNKISNESIASLLETTV